MPYRGGSPSGLLLALVALAPSGGRVAMSRSRGSSIGSLAPSDDPRREAREACASSP